LERGVAPGGGKEFGLHEMCFKIVCSRVGLPPDSSVRCVN
jgi:hypothetical protein